MNPVTSTRLILSAAVLLSLTACGGSGDDDPSPADDGPVNLPATDVGAGAGDADAGDDIGDIDAGTDTDPDTDTGADPDTGTATDPDAGDPGDDGDDGENAPVADVPVMGDLGDDIDLTDASPRVITSSCGALPVSETPFSAQQSAPASLMEGQLARGRVDPDIPANAAHYWSIDLQPGYHHVFVDSRRVDGDDRNIGFEVEELGPDGESVERLINANDAGFRGRFVEFFVNPEQRVLTLRLKPRFVAEDYVIGVFANGRSIPSPYFERCPDIETVSVGTTVATRLREVESEDDIDWYRVDLEEADYVYDSLASRVDGEDRNIIYRAESFDGFGESSSDERVLAVNNVDTVSRDQGKIDRPQAGPIWLRLENPISAALNVEFTINRDE